MGSSHSSPHSDGLHKHAQIKSAAEVKEMSGVKVVSLQRARRGKIGVTGSLVHHKGVIATTADGSKYLVHKGKGYGTKKTGDTVVIDASQMKKHRWEIKEPIPAASGTTVGGLVKKGRKRYSMPNNTCRDAANDMMAESEKQARRAAKHK